LGSSESLLRSTDLPRRKERKKGMNEVSLIELETVLSNVPVALGRRSVEVDAIDRVCGAVFG
jgi:hypothetical protein